MITRRQALHLASRMLNFHLAAPVRSFLHSLSTSSRADAGSCSRPVRVGRHLVCGASRHSKRGDACMVALPPPRLYLPAADWEEDLMPERGPVQFLLLFFRSRATPGWRMGLASPSRCSACCPARKRLPRPNPASPSRCAKPPGTMPLPASRSRSLAVGRHLTRPPSRSCRGSASAPRCSTTEAASAPSEVFASCARPWRSDRHDPHFALGDVAIGDGLPVTAAEGLTPAYQVTGAKSSIRKARNRCFARRRERSAPWPARRSTPLRRRAPPHHRGGPVDPLESQATIHEQKL